MKRYSRDKQKSYLRAILAIFVICSCAIRTIADVQAFNAESFAKDGLLKSQNMASSEESGNSIPGYSKDKASDYANNMEQMDDAEMKSKSQQKMLSAREESPEGIARTGMDKKTIDGYENQEIFTKAEKINEDPVAAYERMINEGCKEKENEQLSPYKKVTKREKITDSEVYEEVCEKPAGNIVCEKTLSVACDDDGECSFDSGGIEVGSVASDMKFIYEYPYLIIGTIADNYWEGLCKEYSRKTTFNIKDLVKIKEFKLVKVGYDDWMEIKINGTQVYNGPYGGDKLELDIKEGWRGYRRVNTGRGVYRCELNSNWNQEVNIDLREYLKEGENTVETKVIVDGRGEGWLKIEASQYCCRSFRDKWEKRCWSE